MPLLSAEGAKTESEKNDLIEWLGACAVHEQEISGIPASITIAQTILETGWLKTDAPQRILMIKEAKNLFGIKGVGPAGSVEISTTEYVDGKPVSELAKFRAYRSYTESFEDHTRILTTSDYYTGALQFRSDPRRYIEEVAKNYATDPQYAAKIWDIVTRYNLTRFDRR
jgi:flagellum-specific peptidoglycan hydrolase FlgJ